MQFEYQSLNCRPVHISPVIYEHVMFVSTQNVYAVSIVNATDGSGTMNSQMLFIIRSGVTVCSNKTISITATCWV